MYEFQVCHWQEHRSQTLRGGVLQKNNRGKWEDKKCVHKKITSPSCDVFLFEFQSQKFQSPSNYLPMYLWKNKTSLQREPRIRVLRKPSNCRVYFVLEFHWSREREREREKETVILTLVCAWFHCSEEQISILELALSPSPLSSWISVGIACFRVFFRVFPSLPLLCSPWV
jgi:hypothetical protein